MPLYITSTLLWKCHRMLKRPLNDTVPLLVQLRGKWNPPVSCLGKISYICSSSAEACLLTTWNSISSGLVAYIADFTMQIPDEARMTGGLPNDLLFDTVHRTM